MNAAKTTMWVTAVAAMLLAVSDPVRGWYYVLAHAFFCLGVGIGGALVITEQRRH